MKNKQLRYLVKCTLYFSTKVKQPNGFQLDVYEKVNDFQVRIQEVDDEISTSIYGTGITNLLRLSSPLGSLEAVLKVKINENEDNITKYTIVIGNKRYKILSVRENWVDIRFISMVNVNDL